MDTSALLTDLFSRVDEHVDDAIDGLAPELLIAQPAPSTNPIGWLIWHLTRVEDHHVAEILGVDQIWMTGQWASQFGVDPDPHNTGYGHSDDEVRSIRPVSSDALLGYYRAVAGRTRDFVATLQPDDLDRVVDKRWNPPVTLGVRLVSIADDAIQHSGQANYARGILERQR